MNSSEFKKVKQAGDKIRPILHALVAEARAESGSVDYAVDASLSLVMIAAYGVFAPERKKPSEGEPTQVSEKE